MSSLCIIHFLLLCHVHERVRTSENFVRKKAALTLLRLYRKHPDVIPAKEWALRIVSIMDDPDLVRINAIHLEVVLTHI